MRRLAAVLALVLLLPAQGLAACFDSQKDLVAWVEGYYLRPEPERLACAAEYFALSPDLSDNPALRRPFAYFVGAAFSALGPMERESVLRQFQDLPDDTARIVLLHGIWYEDTPASRDLLYRLRGSWLAPRLASQLQRMTAERPKLLLSILAPKYEDELKRLAQDIDCLWMRFMATGDPRIVLRVLEVARYSESAPTKGDQLLGFTARWSLRANLKQDKVREVLTARLAKAGDEERRVIEQVFSENAQPEPAPAPGQ